MSPRSFDKGYEVLMKAVFVYFLSSVGFSLTVIAQVAPSANWFHGVTSSGSEAESATSLPVTKDEIARTHSSGLTTGVTRALANWGSVTVSCLCDGDASGRTSSNASAQSRATLIDEITNTSSETIRISMRFELEGESNRGAATSNSTGVADGSGSARSSYTVGSSDNTTARLISGTSSYEHVSVNGRLYLFDFAPVVYELDPGATLSFTIQAITAATAGTRSFRDAENTLIIVESAGEGNAAARAWVESVTDLAGAPVANALTSASGHDYLAEPQPIDFDDWMSLYFLSADALPLETDSDGDGYSNQVEYYAQTRPHRADSNPSPRLARKTDGEWELQFPVLSKLATYQVERSLDLLSPMGFGTVMTARPSRTTGGATIPLPEIESPRAFYRVRISPRDQN